MRAINWSFINFLYYFRSLSLNLYDFYHFQFEILGSYTLRYVVENFFWIESLFKHKIFGLKDLLRLFFILSVVQLVRRLSILKYSLCFHKMKLSRITMTGGKLRREFAQNMAASLWNSRDYPKYCQEMRGISNLLPTAFMEKWEKVGKGGRLWRKCMSPRKFPFSLVRVWGAARRKRDLSVFSGMRIFSILRWAAILK